MSVRTWKRIITGLVLLLIFSLLISTLFLSYNNKLLKERDNLITPSAVNHQSHSYLNNYEMPDLEAYSFEYQEKYPGLYVKKPAVFAAKTDKIHTADKKICYLTFDDGPSKNITDKVLDILKEHDVKATFFVIKNTSKDAANLYKRIVEEGHAIGVHTACHDYTKIYSSVESFLNDFHKCSDHIESITGIKPEIFRFPGGSINAYNVEIYQQLIAEMTRRGYTYYDWNIASGDASRNKISTESLVDNCLKNSNYTRKIVLMHDGRGNSQSVKALPDIIEGLAAQGYEFAALDNTVAPSFFGY